MISDITLHVLLDGSALLGTLTTPKTLGPTNFETKSVGSLNDPSDGFLSGPLLPTFEVYPIPKLVAVDSLVAFGALSLFY